MTTERFSEGEHGVRVNVFRTGQKGTFSAAWRIEGIPVKRSLKTTNPEAARLQAKAISQDLKNRKGLNILNPILYVIQRGEDGPVKIGITTNLDSRLRQIKTSCPEEVKAVAVYRMMDIEKAIQWLLRDIRMNGEWFLPEAKQRIREILPRQFTLNNLKKIKQDQTVSDTISSLSP